MCESMECCVKALWDSKLIGDRKFMKSVSSSDDGFAAFVCSWTMGKVRPHVLVPCHYKPAIG
jgi:hypothetical protein